MKVNEDKTLSNEIEWECIFYNEERDTDGSLIEVSITMEAPYKNGFLIKEIYIDSEDKRSQSIVFCNMGELE